MWACYFSSSVCWLHRLGKLILFNHKKNKHFFNLVKEPESHNSEMFLTGDICFGSAMARECLLFRKVKSSYLCSVKEKPLLRYISIGTVVPHIVENYLF